MATSPLLCVFYFDAAREGVPGGLMRKYGVSGPQDCPRLVFLDQRKEEANRQLPYEGELTGVAVANFLLKQGLQGTGGAADREKDEL